MVYAVINECVIFALRHTLNIKNTLPFINVYIIISFLLLGFYYFIILEKFVKKGIILFLILGFEVLFIFNLVFIQSWLEYPTIFSSIRNILLVAFSIIYFYKIMIEENIKNLWKEARIWINTGVLLYFSGILFSTVLFNFILEYSREFSKLTLMYFSILNVLFYIFIAVGFWKAKKAVEIANK